jgi:hypothetical protein
MAEPKRVLGTGATKGDPENPELTEKELEAAKRSSSRSRKKAEEDKTDE